MLELDTFHSIPNSCILRAILNNFNRFFNNVKSRSSSMTHSANTNSIIVSNMSSFIKELPDHYLFITGKIKKKIFFEKTKLTRKLLLVI